ncbi:MAG: DegV family protein [Candidatus Saccharicenans sp.]
MKIKYLDGRRLYLAFLAGGQAVIKNFSYLNKINVFPVPDGDTGTNLASTVKAIAEQARPSRSLRETLQSISEAALTGARGNSGLIFAQYIYGLSKELGNEIKISTIRFGESVKNAVRYAYGALSHPQEGTMLTLIREWAEEVYRNRHRFSDFQDLLHHSLARAREALQETPKKLAVLRKAGVVDAGARGFVDFIEGVLNFIRQGNLKSVLQKEILEIELQEAPHRIKENIPFRYCTEALLLGENLNLEKIKEIVNSAGDSAIVGGSERKARFHVHTNHPQELFLALRELAVISQPKVEDMKLQAALARNPIRPVALVVDSSCDLPAEILEQNQIAVVPFPFNIGEHVFLDKLTISAEKLYEIMEKEEIPPRTTQPSPKTVENLFSFLSSHFQSILVLTISSGLSGYHQLVKKVAEKFSDRKIRVVDTRHLSGTFGLIVMRLLESWPDSQDVDEMAAMVEEFSRKTEILVDIKTLKFLVKGGRVSPMKGFLARLLNIKPIITLDENGRAAAAGKTFSRGQSFRTILKTVEKRHLERKIHSFAVVHVREPERAKAYAKEIEKICGRPASFIMDTAPVIGVHNGFGSVGICLSYE